VQTLLVDIVVIFALAVLASLVCHRLRIPSSIGLLLAGVLAGPEVLGLVRNVQQIELLSEIGVVLLLFVIGLEISVADIAHLRRQFVVGGSVQLFGTAAIVALGTLVLGSTLAQSIYLGFVVSLSSTAIVLRMLQDRAETDTPHGRSVLAALIYQDIAVVPVMLTAPLLAGVSGGFEAGAVAGLAGRIVAVGVFYIVELLRFYGFEQGAADHVGEDVCRAVEVHAGDFRVIDGELAVGEPHRAHRDRGRRPGPDRALVEEVVPTSDVIEPDPSQLPLGDQRSAFVRDTAVMSVGTTLSRVTGTCGCRRRLRPWASARSATRTPPPTPRRTSCTNSCSAGS